MSNKNLIKKIESFFQNPSSLTMAQIEEFVHETIKTFDKLRHTLASGTEEEKKAALLEAQELQQSLEQFAQKAYAKTGMSEEEVKKFLAQGNHPLEEMQHLKNAEREIEEYRKIMTPEPKAKPKPQTPWGK